MYLEELMIDQGLPLFFTAGVLLSLAIAEWANRHYRTTTAKYAGQISHCGLSGHVVAERLLQKLGLQDITVHGDAAQNVYAPWRRQIQLTDSSCNGPTIVSLASAAHEVGHAEQFATGFQAARLWRVVTPVSYALMAIAIAWTALSLGGVVDSLFGTGDRVVAVLLGLIVVMQIPVHLPLERDASQRARRYVCEAGIIADAELPIFDVLLDAAWKTHLALNVQRWVMAGVLLVFMSFAPMMLESVDGPPVDHSANTVVAAVMPEPASYDPASYDPASSIASAPTQRPNAAADDSAQVAIAVNASDDVIHISLLDCLQILMTDSLGIVGIMLLFGLTFFVSRLPKRFEHQPSREELALQHNNCGSALQQAGKIHAAIQEFSQCLELNPMFTIGWSNIGQARMSLGQFDEAVSDFNRAIELAPRFADALGGRAYARACQGKFEEALDDCNTAIETNPESGDLWLIRGTVQRGLNNHDEAFSDFSRAIELDDRNAASHRERGLERLRLGELDKALSDTQQAVQLDPKDFIALNNRGAILQKLRRYAEAVADFSASIALQPTLAWPYKHLAWIRATCPVESFRDGQQAISDANRALELTQWKQQDWLEVLAAAHAEADQFDKACQWQEKWIESAPPEQAAEAKSRLDQYERNLPFRDTLP